MKWNCMNRWTMSLILVLALSPTLFGADAGVAEYGYGQVTTTASTGWGAALERYASTASKSALTTLSSFKPLGTFIVGYPVNFLRAIKETKYSDRKFIVFDGTESRKAYKEFMAENEQGTFGANGEYGYRLEYDFGFEGSGDINQPIGFRLVDGKYYYRPIKGLFVPRQLAINGIATPIDFYGDNQLLAYFSFKTLSFLLGSTDRATKVWSGLRGVVKLAPEHAFAIRTLVLICDASRNSAAALGYPRFSHVPIEMVNLLSRITSTPNIKKTMALEVNKGIKYPSEWTKVETISLRDLMDSLVPDYLFDLLDQIKVPAPKGELQQMRDVKSRLDKYATPISGLEQLYGVIRSTPKYNDRTTLMLKMWLAKDYTKLDQTDKDLFLYTIRRHIAERFRGYRESVVQYVSSFGDQTDTDSESELDESLPAGAGATSKIARVHLGNLAGLLDSRMPPLKNFIAEAVKKLNTIAATDKLVPDPRQMLSDIVARLDSEILTLKEYGSKAVLAESNAAASTDEKVKNGYYAEALNWAKKIESFLKDREAQEDVMTGARFGDGTESVGFKEYVKLQCFKAEKAFSQRFRGDSGYVFDDSHLGKFATIQQAMAIFLRAAKDLAQAEELFRNDPSEYVMVDADGKQYRVVGQKLYADKVQQPTSYAAVAESKAAQAQAQTIATGTDMGTETLLQKAQYAAQVLQASRSVWVNFLLQYPFDRRNTHLPTYESSVLIDKVAAAGEAAVSGQIAAAQQTVSELSATAVQTLQTAEAQATATAAQAEQTAGVAVTSALGISVPESSTTSATASSSTTADTTTAATSATTATTSSVATASTPLSADTLDIAATTSAQAGSYARTIESFIGEEIAALLTRSKEFDGICRLYLDEILNRNFGISAEQLLIIAQGRQSEVEAEFSQRLEPGFADLATTASMESEMEKSGIDLRQSLDQLNLSQDEINALMQRYDQAAEDFANKVAATGVPASDVTKDWSSYSQTIADDALASQVKLDVTTSPALVEEAVPTTPTTSEVPSYQYSTTTEQNLDTGAGEVTTGDNL